MCYSCYIVVVKHTQMKKEEMRENPKRDRAIREERRQQTLIKTNQEDVRKNRTSEDGQRNKLTSAKAKNKINRVLSTKRYDNDVRRQNKNNTRVMISMMGAAAMVPISINNK